MSKVMTPAGRVTVKNGEYRGVKVDGTFQYVFEKKDGKKTAFITVLNEGESRVKHQKAGDRIRVKVNTDTEVAIVEVYATPTVTTTEAEAESAE